VEDVHGVLPGVELGGVQFARLEHLALDHAVATDPQAFTDRIVSVSRPIFGASAPFKKQAGRLSPIGVRPARG
jgi:hypothetical protein